MRNYSEIPDFNKLKKNIKKDYSDFPKVKVAVLGDSSTQLLTQAIRGYGFEIGFNFVVYEADYNQIDREIINPSSELYQFEPSFIIISRSVHKLWRSFYNSDQENFARNHITEVSNYLINIEERLQSQIIYFNYHEFNDATFGNYANKIRHSFLYNIRAINFKLMNLAAEHKNLNILDISSISGYLGHNNSFDPKIYYNTDITLSLDILPVIGKHISEIITSSLGKFNKCLIMDLDNTIWGGIIGDDGLENIQIGELGIGRAFSDFQYWIKQLKERGIILAVCSKNEESIAKEVFEKHPDMILKLDDISLFVANWNNKVENIKFIQRVLNIGFDSMVFIDDNPVERSLVKTYLPEVITPDLPDDPALYLNYLITLNLFEVSSYSKEDSNRTKKYKEQALRTSSQDKFKEEKDFLKNLNMVAKVEKFNGFNKPRIAQLSQRSNQFNLRTIRYSEEDVEKLIYSENHIPLTFVLEDKFGGYGLICIVVIQIHSDFLFIENWIMSCRVLKRGMEYFVLNTIIEYAKKYGKKNIHAEYIPTAKNIIVKDLYENLGFTFIDEVWKLKVDNFKNKEFYIKEIEHQNV